MKKLFLTLIVVIACFSSAFAQGYVGVNPNGYESHWEFDYHAYLSQEAFVAAIAIDGQIVSIDAENWSALEVAAFITNDDNEEECRGNLIWLTDEYVLEYGDPYLTIDGFPIYYDAPGGTVYFKMYDHANGIEYTECTITYLGEPYTVTAGIEVVEGWNDPENPVILNFTTPEVPPVGCTITVDVDNPWSENFEDVTEVTDDPFTGALPECWEVVDVYTHPLDNNDTLPQVYYKPEFNTTDGGSYSLRMKFRSLLAMPELDESVDFEQLRMSMYVRQPFWSYKLQIGVMTDLEDENTFTPVAVVNNSTKNLTYFECGFAAVKNIVGPGRYIVLKNIGGTEGDLYCSNYIDDITLFYNGENCELSVNDLPYTENFEDYTSLLGETGVEPYCWDVVTEDAALESVSKPQLYSNFNTTEGGLYTLRMKNRCVYAGPKLASDIDVHALTMTLKVRQPVSFYRLQVGVVDAQGNFMPAQTINCTGTDMEEFTVDFSGLELQSTPAETSQYRIAFRNTLAPGVGMSTEYLEYSYNYIDDIELDVVNGQRIGETENGSIDSELDNITVYPNPTTGKLYIDAIGVQKVECYNAMGQLVSVYNNVRDIDLGSLSEGVYTLRITVPQGVTMRKVVKR